MYLWPSDEVIVGPNKVLVSDIRPTCNYCVLTLPVFWMWLPLTEGEFTSYWKRKGTG